MKKLLLFVLFVFQIEAHANFISPRCQYANDSLGDVEAENRTKWAAKCYPGFAVMLEEGKLLIKNTTTGGIHVGYPIFAEVINGVKGAYAIAPIDPAVECWDTNRYQVVGFCVAGCFTPDQNILMNAPGGYVEIKTALDKQYDDIFLIDGVNQHGHFEFKRKTISGYTADLEDRYQPVLIINTKSGGELKVTPNHPLVNGSGYMVEASTLSIGDSLKTVENKNDEIVSIEKINYFGKVYNIDTGSSDIYDNIIVANDFLSGTVYFQNDGIIHLNRLVLRNVNIIPEVMLK